VPPPAQLRVLGQLIRRRLAAGAAPDVPADRRAGRLGQAAGQPSPQGLGRRTGGRARPAGLVAGLFGQLQVHGTANLGGTLALTPVNGYTPTTGDSFAILTYATRGGDFANPPPGFALSYDDVGGILTVIAQ
jgi:hypothetical protein